MGKYILKRLGYMVVVALILSLLMFLVYTMIPYDRAVVEIDAYKASLKNNPNAAELYEQKLAEKRHELGTDQNVLVRYLGWVWCYRAIFLRKQCVNKLFQLGVFFEIQRR